MKLEMEKKERKKRGHGEEKRRGKMEERKEEEGMWRMSLGEKHVEEGY